MEPEYHSTKDYHLNELQILGWELTVCNMLSAEVSPCRDILKTRSSYGRLLHAFLGRFIPIADVRHVLEIGGGYGYLMRDLLALQPGLHAVMLDLSPALLGRQRLMLQDSNVDFIHADFLDTDSLLLKQFDLAILNENLGDFPMLLNVAGKALEEPDETGGPLQRVRGFFTRYGLDRPAADPFHCNLGAMEAVEKLCLAGVPSIFLSEHSCEAVVPESLRDCIDIRPSGNPERIRLRGHDEYTIAFTSLEAIARRLGYNVVRGPLADFIEVDLTDRIRFILRSRLHMNEEHEAIRQFVEDLYKYEYLLLTRQR